MSLRMRMSWLVAVSVLVGSLLWGCTPAITYEPIVEGLEPKPAATEVVVFSLDEEVPSPNEVIGIVSVGETGFTIVCGYNDVIERAKKRALEVGGNAIKLIEVKEPDLASSCYRISAQVLLLGESGT